MRVGAWGDASPQTPAIQTLWRMVEWVLVSESALPDTADVPDRRGGGRGPARHGPARRREAVGRHGAGRRGPFPISSPHDFRDECMAGVWGEASPQAPPEARWTAGRSRGASQPWAGGRGEGRVIVIG